MLDGNVHCKKKIVLECRLIKNQKSNLSFGQSSKSDNASLEPKQGNVPTHVHFDMFTVHFTSCAGDSITNTKARIYDGKPGLGWGQPNRFLCRRLCRRCALI